MSGAKDVEKVATGTSDGKNRKRGRGKTKTTTDDHEGVAAADTAAPPQDNDDRPSTKKKTAQQPEAQPSAPALSSDLAAAVTALNGIAARLDKKGQPKGYG